MSLILIKIVDLDPSLFAEAGEKEKEKNVRPIYQNLTYSCIPAQRSA